MTPIFVLGHARSGSTLIQRLLNSADGVRIYGEHGGALHYVAGAYRVLCIDKREQLRGDATFEEIEKALSDPKCNVSTTVGVSTEQVRRLSLDFIRAVGNPFNKDVRWGFKEVRYGLNANVIDMLMSLLPECQIIFTTRDPYGYCRSLKSLGWMHDLMIQAKHWREQSNTFAASLEKYPRSTRHLPYGATDFDYAALFNWLGLAWTDKQREILNGDPVGASSRAPTLTSEEIDVIRSITKVEPLAGSDPATSSLPRTRSTN